MGYKITNTLDQKLLDHKHGTNQQEERGDEIIEEYLKVKKKRSFSLASNQLNSSPCQEEAATRNSQLCPRDNQAKFNHNVPSQEC